MVLTVTINPLLEHRFTFANINFNKPNRNGNLKLAAGGKGINVSRQLKNLGIQNIALFFAGGTNGKLLRNAIKDESIDFSIINTKSETRTCAVIFDSNRNKAYYFFQQNSAISKEEKDKFLLKLDKMIQNCEIVIFSGSSPSPEADDIFPLGIKMANKYDKISVCDTYGKHLNDCLDASPGIVHNNLDEIKSSLNLNLNDEKEKIEFLSSLYEKGIKQVYISDGEKDFYASNFDFHYKILVPKIELVDSTGSGDAFVAGIVYGWHRKLTFNDQLKIATALGAVNAKSFEVCNVNPKEIKSLSEKVNIKPIGKRVKIIDDTPD